MVDYQHIRAELNRAVRNLLGAVQSKGDGAHLVCGIAANKAYGIPLFGQMGRIGLIQNAAHIAHSHSRHGDTPLCSILVNYASAISCLPHYSTICAKGFRMTESSSHSGLYLVFVCTGNICRSPMAEIIVRDEMEDDMLVLLATVDSCGLGGWHVGQDEVATR